MKHLAIIALATLALAGCAEKDMKLPDWNWSAVTLEQDNTCATMRKVTWSVDDTPETIAEARKHNARYERLCGKPKPLA